MDFEDFRSRNYYPLTSEKSFLSYKTSRKIKHKLIVFKGINNMTDKNWLQEKILIQNGLCLHFVKYVFHTYSKFSLMILLCTLLISFFFLLLISKA